MNTIAYIQAFAWIAIIGLTLHLAKDFIVPVSIVAFLIFVTSSFRKRH